MLRLLRDNSVIVNIMPLVMFLGLLHLFVKSHTKKAWGMVYQFGPVPLQRTQEDPSFMPSIHIWWPVTPEIQCLFEHLDSCARATPMLIVKNKSLRIIQSVRFYTVYPVFQFHRSLTNT